jgi:hypothetical protein
MREFTSNGKNIHVSFQAMRSHLASARSAGGEALQIHERADLPPFPSLVQVLPVVVPTRSAKLASC